MVSQTVQERYLVTGGLGFLGSYIVEALIARGERGVAVYNRSPPAQGDAHASALYFTGDISDEKRLLEVLQETKTTTVFHVVSAAIGAPREVHQRVNVEGTRCVISACRAAGVKTLVFTSSTGVVWSGQAYRGATEEDTQMTTPSFRPYNYTKALAEKLVLAANGVGGLRTVSLRACGMIGPRAKLLMWTLAQAYEQGNHVYQMGDGTNLVDYTYAGNVADAHLLAADKLSPNNSMSSSRDSVAGEAFFITDGKPLEFWSVPRMIWKSFGYNGQRVVRLSRSLCFLMAFCAELVTFITRRPASLSMYLVLIVTTDQWYSNEKAQRLLGYQPRVSIEDACDRTIDWWNERGMRERAESLQSTKSK